MIVSCKFLKFLHYLCFEVEKLYADLSNELPCSRDLKKSDQLSRFLRLPKHLFVDFSKCSKFISNRAKVAG